MSLLNQIKAINQRLADFEKQGYKSTREYKNLIKEIDKSGLRLTKSKEGNIRISRAKENIENRLVKTAYGNKLEAITLLDRLMNKKTLGKLKKEVKSTFTKDELKDIKEEDIKKRAVEISDVREYVYSEKDEWYLLLSKYHKKNTSSVQEYKEKMHEDMFNITDTMLKERQASIDEYKKNAPSYIREALEGDI